MASGIPCSANPQNNDLLFFIWSQACLISSCGLWRCELRFKKHRYEKFNSLGPLGCYKNVGIPERSLYILEHGKSSPRLNWLLRLSLAHCPDKGSWGNFLLIIHTSCAFHECPPAPCWSACLCRSGHWGSGLCSGEWMKSSCLLQMGGGGMGPSSIGFQSRLGRQTLPILSLAVLPCYLTTLFPNHSDG